MLTWTDLNTVMDQFQYCRRSDYMQSCNSAAAADCSGLSEDSRILTSSFLFSKIFTAGKIIYNSEHTEDCSVCYSGQSVILISVLFWSIWN